MKVASIPNKTDKLLIQVSILNYLYYEELKLSIIIFKKKKRVVSVEYIKIQY